MRRVLSLVRVHECRCLPIFSLLLRVIAASMSASALTVTTFNMLAPVHRSMDASNRRESELEEWWRPRAEGLACFVADELKSSDIILLQEWWFRDEFVDLFDSVTRDIFERAAERRPSLPGKPPREDGMAVLVKKGGRLNLLESQKVFTGPQRISQLVCCRERGAGGRFVHLANAHLSFPSSPDALMNNLRQAREVQVVAKALANAQFTASKNVAQVKDERMELIGGDFNSDSRGLAAHVLEKPPHNFVNCASASAEQALSGPGGQINLGVTHRTHLGEHVSVDHIFCRLASQQQRTNGHFSALRQGYLDTEGTRIIDCHRGHLAFDGHSVISDHRPVTATLEWPCELGLFADGADISPTNAPLDPLEPPSYMGNRSDDI